MSTQQTLSVDFSQAMEEAKKTLLNAGVHQARQAATLYFQTRYDHNLKQTVKGPGVLEIDEFLDKQFGSPEFKAKMEKFLEENFERLFEEAMAKAVQHRVNRLAFEAVDQKKPL